MKISNISLIQIIEETRESQLARATNGDLKLKPQGSTLLNSQEGIKLCTGKKGEYFLWQYHAYLAHRSLERQIPSKETREKIKSSPGVKFPSVAEVTTAFEKTRESKKGPISLDVHVEMLGHIGKKLYERQEFEAENIAETLREVPG